MLVKRYHDKLADNPRLIQFPHLPSDAETPSGFPGTAAASASSLKVAVSRVVTTAAVDSGVYSSRGWTSSIKTVVSSKCPTKCRHLPALLNVQCSRLLGYYPFAYKYHGKKITQIKSVVPGRRRPASHPRQLYNHFHSSSERHPVNSIHEKTPHVPRDTCRRLSSRVETSTLY